MKRGFSWLLIPVLLLNLLFSCRKDEYFTDDPGAKLDFSADSILFDTVFTQIGSTTQAFLVYNNNNKSVKISSIRLAGGNASNFRINIDGLPVNTMSDIIIRKKDSLWIFVEVTVDPNNLNNPLVIHDFIEFETNGNLQKVTLEAWGQDAYYHKPTIFPTNGFPPFSVFKCNDVWTNDKPHVIYGYAVVDSACTLTMMPGTRVYMHNNAVLWIYSDGTLKVKGDMANPVTFQGDRLEPEYKEIAGQWGKIWLSAGSKNNEVDWAIIKNGGIGLQADTMGNSTNPTLTVSNTIIKNMSAAAIFGQGSSIKAYNCIFANCGQYSAALTIGGNYSFYHCTFANYWAGVKPSRTTPLLWLNNWYKDVNDNVQIRNMDSAYFGNCIIYGTLENEISLDTTTFGGKFKVIFDHTLIKIDPAINTSNVSRYNTILKNLDPQFADPANNNYGIKGSSPAIDKGRVDIGLIYPLDIRGKTRQNNGLPDLGAYEFY